MKKFEINKLFFVCVLLCGLFVAYSVATPQAFSGNDTFGAGYNCYDDDYYSCSTYVASHCSGDFQASISKCSLNDGNSESAGSFCSGSGCSTNGSYCDN